MNLVLKLTLVMAFGLLALNGCGLRQATRYSQGEVHDGMAPPAATGSVPNAVFERRGCH